MMSCLLTTRGFKAVMASALLVAQSSAQRAIPPGFNRPNPSPPPAAPTPQQVPPQQAAPPPAAAAQQAPGQAAPGQAAPAPAPPAGGSTGGLNLQNASLREVIDILARQLR